MSNTAKALVAGIIVLTGLAVPAAASADTPQMYDPCAATLEGQRITTPSGDTLECVATDVGTGYDWEEPN
ncbi:hypothetical protein TPAU25S_00463 [Tsukamurella paurometabola]|uniref:DUF333 domain-containing protein n=1 Tax=Tsukamurella paurometabola (strain ATCC 8368 / DSM 20162 / CCUG 35730 / CIP 100753 / JCM 10117 / KCTC 9821 / NBRC 16120 / NCIMB 702349 / NCTC 13040) TaxID=521096 RepID=D5UVJ7_TSUPD|nr:hypothetical protein [Tsukamurella paurometabola]ADG79779.1 hypothetical protein Tpau_3192 [Tsukamurella paurometabola DSM 20162]SUP37186.1 Uncharacterised protein [Tsukamurella paurometabola]